MFHDLEVRNIAAGNEARERFISLERPVNCGQNGETMSHTVAIPVELFNNPEITPQAYRLIAFILHKAEEVEHNFELHTKAWAETLNCAPSTLRRWIKYLAERGYLVYQKTFGRAKQFKVVLGKLAASFAPPPKCESPRKETKLEPEPDFKLLHERLSPQEKRTLIGRVHERLSRMVGTIERTYEHEQLANEIYKRELIGFS